MTTVENLHISLQRKQPEIKKRLQEFSRIIKTGSSNEIFLELVFCIFTAGASAKMGLNAVNAVKTVALHGTVKEISNKLRGVYRFPNTRSRYIVHTREFLENEYNFKLKELILSFEDPIERRDFLALNKDIMGIGFKESSHFLRNIGFKGYAIIDKHLLNSLKELKIIKNNKPPINRAEYQKIENKLKKFSSNNNFDFDELDLLLWSEKTGEILK